MSDMESSSDVSTAGMITRSGGTITSTKEESTDEKISGNVQILKKNFEAKATSGSGPKKGQSLPSSPVAQHCNEPASSDSSHLDSENTPTPTIITSSLVVTPVLSNTSNIITSEPKDRNVKGLVSKYQSSRSHSNHHSPSTSSSIMPSSAITTTTAAATLPYKARPRSYYESRSYCSSATPSPHHYKDMNSSSTDGSTTIVSNSGLIAKVHDYNTRPPVPPLLKNHTADATTTHHTMTDSILTQNLSCNYRRVQQHGKTHPLARLSLPKQRFNAAAYNTM